jgi:hypothetical protein
VRGTSAGGIAPQDGDRTPAWLRLALFTHNVQSAWRKKTAFIG